MSLSVIKSSLLKPKDFTTIVFVTHEVLIKNVPLSVPVVNDNVHKEFLEYMIMLYNHDVTWSAIERYANNRSIPNFDPTIIYLRGILS